jgi:hypothetical protein
MKPHRKPMNKKVFLCRTRPHKIFWSTPSTTTTKKFFVCWTWPFIGFLWKFIGTQWRAIGNPMKPHRKPMNKKVFLCRTRPHKKIWKFSQTTQIVRSRFVLPHQPPWPRESGVVKLSLAPTAKLCLFVLVVSSLFGRKNNVGASVQIYVFLTDPDPGSPGQFPPKTQFMSHLHLFWVAGSANKWSHPSLKNIWPGRFSARGAGLSHLCINLHVFMSVLCFLRMFDHLSVRLSVQNPSSIYIYIRGIFIF